MGSVTSDGAEVSFQLFYTGNFIVVYLKSSPLGPPAIPGPRAPAQTAIAMVAPVASFLLSASLSLEFFRKEHYTDFTDFVGPPMIFHTLFCSWVRVVAFTAGKKSPMMDGECKAAAGIIRIQQTVLGTCMIISRIPFCADREKLLPLPY